MRVGDFYSRVPEPVTLPRSALERVERVLDYHRASKHTPESVGRLTPNVTLAGRPNPYRSFPGLPTVPLSTQVLDLPISAVSLMRDGLGAVPESHVSPPQNLKTLSTWLFMAYGITSERKFGADPCRLRACPSAGALYPCELYVAAFSIDGIEPGLYSFNPRQFSLVRLRDGAYTLAQIKRGRPELAFLRSVPGALLVSTIFCRSTWKYRQRGYRVALLDCGHLIGNAVAAANGLGIQTMTRLKLNDSTTRELIGAPLEPTYDQAESVQAMIVWADGATCPIQRDASERSSSASAPPLEIAREPLSAAVTPYGSVIAVHQDCVAPGIPVREIRPPLTELSPMPATHPLNELRIGEEIAGTGSMRKVLLGRRSARDFLPAPISRDRLLTINRSGFRTGTFVPIHPDGSYVGLVRPFWFIQDVSGIGSGIWYYHPPLDRWTQLKTGAHRDEIRTLCLGQEKCAKAAAVCVMVSHLKALTSGAGPDAYRLAHLEAGVAAQRLSLAAAACEVAACPIISFYDDELRHFLGLQNTGLEVLYAVAFGIAAPDPPNASHPSLGIG